ncbi:MAG TPA: DoxX family protein [Solirubrobacterales bacterium]|jgi:putative oxidoreductase|nr:DoxX family protein [Solirubrobacterales bacterium]
MSTGLLILRLTVGLLLAAHGAQKLFGMFGGYGLRGTAEGFAQMQMRSPALMAMAAGAAEFFGGLMFAAGLLTPLAALVLMIVMFTAIATVHWANGLFATEGGYEYNLVIIAALAAVCATGPGGYSIDEAIGLNTTDWHGWEWAAGVFAAALIIAMINVSAMRQRRAVGEPMVPGPV